MYYWVKIVALKGKKNFISIKPTKSKLTILSKNYYVVKKKNVTNEAIITNLEEIKTHDLA